MSGNNTPLSQRSFDLWKGEHDKRLEEHFNKVCESINTIKEQQKTDQASVANRFSNVYRYLAVGFVVACFVGLVMHIPGVGAALLKVLKFVV